MVALVQPWVSLHQQLGRMKEEVEEVEGRGGGGGRGLRDVDAEGGGSVGKLLKGGIRNVQLY